VLPTGSDPVSGQDDLFFLAGAIRRLGSTERSCDMNLASDVFGAFYDGWVSSGCPGSGNSKELFKGEAVVPSASTLVSNPEQAPRVSQRASKIHCRVN
jgi:hypothetical protein